MIFESMLTKLVQDLDLPKRSLSRPILRLTIGLNAAWLESNMGYIEAEWRPRPMDSGNPVFRFYE